MLPPLLKMFVMVLLNNVFPILIPHMISGNMHENEICLNQGGLLRDVHTKIASLEESDGLLLNTFISSANLIALFLQASSVLLQTH